MFIAGRKEISKLREERDILLTSHIVNDISLLRNWRISDQVFINLPSLGDSDCHPLLRRSKHLPKEILSLLHSRRALQTFLSKRLISWPY
jgi:hypothetical protein